VRKPIVLGLSLLFGAGLVAAQDFANIKNFLRVNEEICTGGQPSMDDLAKMKEQGVKAIINLRQASEYNAEEEAARVKELGLRYFHIPVKSTEPKDEQVAEFLKVMADPANRPVYIHCMSANRVGGFWLIRRVLVDNWKLEDAIQEAEKIGLSNPVTRQFALDYVARYQARQQLASIRNFLHINNDFCTGGQPRPEEFEKLKAARVRVVINLRTPGEHRAAEEEEMVKQLGLRYINIPVVFTAPKEEQADEFLRVTDDPANRPAFIHCTSAIRVGAFWMIRRVLRDGWTVEAAEAEAEKIGLHHSPHLNEFARAYIAKHKKQ
jgi:uncharacterized protein (TIGR01244 family)